MKMLLSKCRLFIISLTFCYLLDSVFATAAKDVALLKEYNFKGQLLADANLVKSKMKEYKTKKTKTQEDKVIFHRYFLFLNKLNNKFKGDVFEKYENQSWEEYNALQDPKDFF